MLGRLAKRNPAPPRLTDLAAELKLSKAAVSRVLSQAPASRSIPPETQARIFAAAKQMGYVPNLLARSLKFGRSASIAVIVPTLEDVHTARIVSGLEQEIGDAQQACLVLQHHCSRQKLNDLQEVVKLRRVDGIITICSALPWAASVPLVTVACPTPLPKACNLQLDHFRTAYMGLKRLKSQGHNRVALICGQDESPDAQPRAEAILDVASRLSMSISSEMIEKLKGNEPASDPGYRATQRLLARTRAFSAIFAFNDYTAIGAVRALREQGLRVPEDIAVLGVDDVHPAAYHDPPLTTMRQPLFKMGQLAARKLLARIENPADCNIAELVSIQPSLVVRQSA